MKTIRIFISSPGDVAEERERAKRVVEGLRKRYASRLVLETVLWEELPLTATMTFQDGIEKVILAESYGVDVAVFVLWSRLGSPLGAGFHKDDGTAYRSGTEREFDLMLTAYEQSGHTRPQIFAYVRQDQDGFIEAQRGKDTSALSEMVRQREMLEAFIREEFHDPETGTNLRAYHTFPQPSTFAVRLRQHLRALLDEMAAEAGVPVDQQWEDEPYLGLRAFDLQHAPIFFGREQETGTVMEALQQQQRNGCAFVLLVGGSGSGKSSLVRAGVIPELIESGDDEGIAWRRAVLTPGECAGGLLHGLARALLTKDALPELREDDGILQELAADFASAPKQAAQQVRRALQRVSSGSTAAHLVLLVDQFEEVFTHAAFSDADIQALAEALKALAESTRVSVLATVRSDFYGRCQQVPALMAMKSPAGQIDLVAPGPVALARIIGRPAQLAGLHFEENSTTGETLNQRILADIGNNPEALPLVEFALTQLWENRSPDGKLTFAQYNVLGGVEGAIGHHAETIYQALPDAVRAEFAAVFNALVTLNEADDSQAVRRRVALDTITVTPARKQLVEALTNARLLTSDRGEVFVAHEALLRVWPKAQEWIETNRDFLRTRSRMDVSLLRWKAENKHRDYLLPEGKPLADAQELQKQWQAELSAEQHDYITRSATYHEERRKQRLRIYQIASAVLLLLAVLAVIGGVMAWRKTLIAKEQSQRAEAAATKSKADEKKALDAATQATAAESRALDQIVEAARKAYGTARDVFAAGKDPRTGFAHLAEALRYNTHLPPEKQLAALHDDAVQLLLSLPTVDTLALGEPMRHDKFVRSASFSPDGRHVVTASWDQTARLWDATTGKPVGEPMRHDKFVMSAGFSPDGRHVVTISDKAARLWDAATGKPVGEPLRHEGEVFRANFSPDGKRVVTASSDKTARLWDAATGQSVGEPMMHKGRVNTASFSPDGRCVVTASYDRTARLWDAATGQPVGEPMRLENNVNGVSFSADGRHIVTTSDDGDTCLWDTATGQPVSEQIQLENEVWYASYSPDGRRIVTISDKAVQLWDTTTGKSMGEPMRYEGFLGHMSFSPDGRRIVTASGNNARIWDTATGKPVGEPMRHEAQVNTASFSPDGRHIVTASDDKSACIWSAATGKPVGEPMRLENEVRSASFSPDGRRVVRTSDDMSARLWDTATGKPVGKPMRHQGRVNNTSFSPDGRRVVTASEDFTARIWDTSSGIPVGEPMRHEDQVNSASFSLDGRQVVTVSNDKTARIWDVTTGQPVSEPMRHESRVYHASFSSDSRRVVTASDKTARLWDATTGKPASEPMQHGALVTSAIFSPDGRRIATACEDRTVQLWDSATGNPVGDPMRHGTIVNIANFSPDGRRLVTITWIPTIAQLWDTTTGKPVGKPMRLNSAGYRICFSPDGCRIVTASEDKTAQIWDTTTGKPVGMPMRSDLRSASFSPDGRRIVTASYDGAARLWDAATGKPVCELMRRDDDDVEHASFSPDSRRVLTDGVRQPARLWDAAIGESLATGADRLEREQGVTSVPLSFEKSDRHSSTRITVSPGDIDFGAGKKINEDGESVDIPQSEITAWRSKLMAQPAAQDDPWHRLLRWKLSDPSTRTITFNSTTTAPEHIEREITWAMSHLDATKKSPSILTEAYDLDPGSPLIHLTLAAVAKDRVTREFLKDYGLKRLAAAEAISDKAAYQAFAGTYRAKATIILSLQGDQPSAAQVFAALLAKHDPQSQTWGSPAWIEKLDDFEWPKPFREALIELANSAIKKVSP